MSTSTLSPSVVTDIIATSMDGSTQRSPLAVTQPRVLSSEWLKFRSVRSNMIGIGAAVLVAVALGALFSSLAGGDAAGGPGSRGGSDPLSLSFGGFGIAQMIVGVFAVLFVAGEYSSGLIRTTFTAVGNRLSVLWAKATVFGVATLVAMSVAVVAAFLVGQAVYAGDMATLSLGDDGVLRAVLGQAFYLAGIAVMGVALGFILRGTAAAIAVLFTSLLLLPVIVGLLPDSINDTLGKVLPSNAGSAFTSITSDSNLLSAGAGAAVFAAWVVGLVALAAILLTRRDA
ncbi:MAG: ABC transporter permease [Ilumatobacteraceae bacterium]